MSAPIEHAGAAVAPIRDGVFFTAPRSLPRGRHALDAEVVRAAQRQRMLIAATELLAHGGVQAISAKRICARAGASLAAFYDCFLSKEACIFAAYDRFIEIVLEHLGSAADSEEQDWELYVGEIIAAYLNILARDVVVARAFQVEMDSMGAIARARRRDALGGLAAFLRDMHVARDPDAERRLPPEAYLAVLYGVRQMASDALDTDRPDLEGLTPALTTWAAEALGRRDAR